MKKIGILLNLIFGMNFLLFSQETGINLLKFGMNPQEVSRAIGKTLGHSGDSSNVWYYAENLSDGTKHILFEITKDDGLVGYRIQIDLMNYDQAKEKCVSIVSDYTKKYGEPKVSINNHGMISIFDPITFKRTDYGRPVYYEWSIARNNNLGVGIATITVTVTHSNIDNQKFTVETLYQSIIQYNQIQAIINSRRQN